jgi:hypothetical protein
MEDTGDYEGPGDFDEAADKAYWPGGFYSESEYEDTAWLLSEPITHWKAICTVGRQDHRSGRRLRMMLTRTEIDAHWTSMETKRRYMPTPARAST